MSVILDRNPGSLL